MRFFWKVLLFAIPLGSYWLYKKGSRSSSGDTQKQPEQAEVNETAPPEEKQEKASQSRKEKKVPAAQIVERLTDIEGVTSRVAKNLVERGITSKEALLKLSEEELKSIKGIGPKRAAKILNLR